MVTLTNHSIRLPRGKVVHRSKPHDVYIGRPTIFGNPYPKKKYGLENCIVRYRDYLYKRLREDADFRDQVKSLYGKTLGCWCHNSDNCHGTYLLMEVRRLNEG